MQFWLLSSGCFLGWGLGANDSANIFGTAVYTKVITYRLAVILTSVFVIIGALIDGDKGLSKVSEFASGNGIISYESAFMVMLAAGLTVMVMTLFRLPVSTSQSVVGAILGFGLFHGMSDLSKATEFFGAWILTPVGGLFFAVVLYGVTVKFFEAKLSSYPYFERFIKLGYILAGILAAYSLGANNVANVFGVFMAGQGFLTPELAALLGGLTIAFGVVTYSKPVMMTVGKGIVPLTNVTGFLVVIASAITVYIYAKVGIPVSSSQAVVGAITGIGLIKDRSSIRVTMLLKIFSGWILTPTISGLVTAAILFVVNL